MRAGLYISYIIHQVQVLQLEGYSSKNRDSVGRISTEVKQTLTIYTSCCSDVLWGSVE